MNSSVATPEEFLGPNAALESEGPRNTLPLPGHVARRLLSGTSALTLGIMIERGAGFLANILAARFAGATVFGAYALAISTANNISTYAAGGIGSTAARFSGKYPYGTRGYSALARALIIVSITSAAIAVAGLWFGAAPIASLLHKPNLTGLLRWASISACGIILLECARGFFVGQRRLAAVVLLSVLVACGMLAFVPWAAARHRPMTMVVSQGLVTVLSVTVCLCLARPLKLLAPAAPASTPPLTGILAEVWTFGAIQLGGMIGANLSGWWLTALVARADTTLIQMSFFTIASQFRNLASLAPSLLTEGSYAILADPDGEGQSTPYQVMSVCTFAATSATLVLAALGIIVLPLFLGRLYGASFREAYTATALGLAVAVAHMGNAPATARLSIVSIRSAGVINSVWAVIVAAAATLLLFHGGTAATAMAIFFGAHTVSGILTLAVLARKDQVPHGMVWLFSLSTLSMVCFSLLTVARAHFPGHASFITLGMVATLVLSVAALFRLGKHHGWLPSRSALNRLAAIVTQKVRGLRHRDLVRASR